MLDVRSWLALVLLSSCSPGLVSVADGGVLLAGLSPWAIDRVAIGSVTDWDVWTAQDWARQCRVRNEHAANPMFLGNYDETGAFVAATDNYVTIPAAATFAYELVADISVPDTVHRAIPLASTTASHPVSILCVAAVP